MKKRLLAAAVAAMVTLSANAALAFPLDVTGDFRLQARSIDDGIAGGAADKDNSWFQLRTRLNFSGEVDKDTTFFGRFSARNDFGGNQTGNGASFDQYGVKLKASDWKVSIGRQAVNLGQGTIISTGSDAVGVDNKFDGVIASTKSGVVDVNLIAGKTNAANVGYNSEWYGFDASTKLNDKVTAGAAYAATKDDNTFGDALKIWSVNTSASLSKNFGLNAEYAKSDADDNNSAYFVAGTYSKDKDSFTVQYNNVKNNAVDQNNSGIGAVAYPFWGNDLLSGNTGYKGFTYVYSRTINKNLSAHAIYMDLEVDGKAGSDKELAAGLVWGF